MIFQNEIMEQVKTEEIILCRISCRALPVQKFGYKEN